MGTIDVGAEKWNAKKGTMKANYHLDADAWEAGLKAAGLSSVKSSRKTAYSGATSYAKKNYDSKIDATSGERWKSRFVAAMQG
jgi:hypothetical protein